MKTAILSIIVYYLIVVRADVTNLAFSSFPDENDVFVVGRQEVHAGYLGDSYIDLHLKMKVMLEGTNTSALELVVDKCDGEGIGHIAKSGTFLPCCTKYALEMDLCPAEQLHKMILKDAFQGEYKSIQIDKNGNLGLPNDGSFHFPISTSGEYCIYMANCNANSAVVSITGELEFENSYGELPAGEAVHALFVCVLTILYIALLTWFATAMRRNKESRTPIEKWILLTITFGLLEAFFFALHFWMWNRSGSRGHTAFYTGLLVSCIKQGFGRCLILMMCLGWGITRDSLGCSLYAITVLGGVYVALELARQLIAFDFVKEYHIHNMEKVEDDLSYTWTLGYFILILNITFLVWTFVALRRTMDELRETNQTRKLERFVSLRRLLIGGITATVVLVLLLISFATSTSVWLDEVGEKMIFLFFVASVAILWKPNPAAREYAYAIELPSDDNELELTEGVPTASSFDKDENALDGRFQIDDEDDDTEII